MRLGERLLRQARPVRAALALAVGLGLLAGVVVAGQARFLSGVVSQVFLEDRSLAQVTPMLAVLLVLALVRAALAWGSEVAANRVAGRVKSDLREQLVTHLLALGPAYTRGERSGELSNTAVEGIEALDAYFCQYLPQLALAALVPVTVLLFVFPLDWVSGLVLLLTAPLLPVFMVLIGNLADGLTRRQWTSLSRMSAHFLDVLQGLSTLKVLGRSREEIGTIAEISDGFRKATMGVLRVAFLSALVLEMVATVSTAVVAVQVGLRLLYGHLSFEQAFFVLLLAPEFYLPLRLLGTRFHAGTAGVGAARRIYEVLSTKVEAQSESEAEAGLCLSLDLADVHYAYDEGQRPALRGLSLSIAQGEKVALVGPSGAGKSTVAHLLLRFVEPDHGTIIVDGRDLHSIPATVWRREVAWVPQDPYLFFGSVADNIRLARPEASADDVAWAARQAHAHAFIEALPQGYDTVIGERGARLSGGEAQRIALARAFLKDAPFVILDEATANLDPETDDLIQEALARLLQGRTALIISHRLGTAVRADRIVVMDEGRAVESGSHAALLQQGGLYRRLVTAYASNPGYRPEATSSVTPSLGKATAPCLPPGARDIPCLPPGARDIPCPPPGATAKEAVALRCATGIAILRRDRVAPPATVPAPFAALSDNKRSARPPRTLARLLSLATAFFGQMALAVLLGVATIGSSIGLMTTSAYIIARAALHPSIADLQVAIVGVRFFGIARGMARYLERVVSHDVTFRLLARLRVWFYQALEPLAPARLMQYRSGDLLSRIVADVDTLQDFFLRAIAPPAVAVLATVLAAILVGSFNPWLAIPLLGFLLMAGAGVPLLVWALSRTPGRLLVQVRSELNATLVDGIQGLPDLLAFGQEARTRDKVRGLSRDLGTQQARMASIGGLHTALTGLLMNLATLVELGVAIPLVSTGHLDGVFLALLTLAVMSSFEGVLPLSQAFQTLAGSLEAGRRLFEIVDTEPAVYEPPSPNPVPISKNAALRAEGVTFSYAPGLLPALDGISFELPRGKRLAVVGPSGAGKSTLIHLLLRFWETQGGHILLDGRELREYGQDDWRRLVGVVSEHTHLFNATVRENLLLARPEASDEEMVQAARGAQIHEFVESLPQGYDTWIGEQGLRLSGGQRQRLAIARAILRDAPLLILDEPTANLDALTEREVLASVRALMAGRTVLIVTHRLVGLEDADEILVLRSGRIVERGRHRELLAVNGLYHRMWEIQTQALV